MKKRILVQIAGVTVILLVGVLLALVNLNSLIDHNRGALLRAARDAVGRDVSAGSIRASFVGGASLRVDSVVVLDDPEFSPRPFLTVQSIRVRVRFAPLLRRRLVVSSVDLYSPSATIIRNSEGRLNVESLGLAARALGFDAGEVRGRSVSGRVAISTGRTGRRLPAGAVSGVAVMRTRRMERTKLDSAESPSGRFTRVFARSASAGATPSAPSTHDAVSSGIASIRLDHLRVRGGTVTFDDRVGAAVVSAREVEGTLDDVSRGATARFSCAFGISPGRRVVEITGTARIPAGADEQPAVEVTVHAGPIDAGALTDRLARDGIFRGTGNGRSRDGSDTTGARTPAVVLKGTFDTRATVRVRDGGLQGHIESDWTAVRIERAGQWVKPAGTRCVVRATVSRSGSDQPVVRATAEIGDLQTPYLPAHPSIRRAAFVLRGATPDSVDATIQIGRTRARLVARRGPSSSDKLAFHLSAPRVWRTDFQNVADAASRADVLHDVRVDGDVSLYDARYSGHLVAARGIVAALPCERVAARLGGDAGEMRVNDLHARLLDGSLAGDLRVDFSGRHPAFTWHLQGDSVNVARVIAARHPGVAPFLEGRASFTIAARGKGNTWKTMEPTLSGVGRLETTAGRIVGLDLLAEIVHGVETLPVVPDGFARRVLGARVVPGGNAARGQRAVAVTTFRSLRGSIEFRDGKVYVKGLALRGSDLSVEGGGAVGFDGAMHLGGTIKLSATNTATVVRELAVASYLKGADGRIGIPVVLAGRIDRPRIEVDARAVGKTLHKSLLHRNGKVGDRLRGLLGGFGHAGGVQHPDSS